MAATPFNSTQIQHLLARPKLAGRWSGWERRSNHAGHVISTAELFELDGTTIPGVTVQFEVKAPVVALSCLFLLSVMQLTGRDRRRIFQLEVCPPSKRSHNGPIPLYGPHEHVGNLDPSPVTTPDVNCENWSGSTNWFLLRTGIAPFPIQSPTEP